MSNVHFFTPQGDEKGKFNKVFYTVLAIYAHDEYFNIITHTTKIISHLNRSTRSSKSEDCLAAKNKESVYLYHTLVCEASLLYWTYQT